MDGRGIALAALMRERVEHPCINCSWMTSTTYIMPVVPHVNIDALFRHGMTSGTGFLSA